MSGSKPRARAPGTSVEVLFCASASALAISSRLTMLRTGSRPCGPCGSERFFFAQARPRSRYPRAYRRCGRAVALADPAGPSSATKPRCFDGNGPRPADRKRDRAPRRCPTKGRNSTEDEPAEAGSQHKTKQKKAETPFGSSGLSLMFAGGTRVGGEKDRREERENPRPANSVILSCRRALRARRCRGR